MPTPITNFRLSADLLGRMDAARGGESRTSFVVRAVEAQLDREASVVQVPRLARRAQSSAAAKAGVVPR